MPPLVFFGSSPFSVLVLEKVLSTQYKVLSVVTTPDVPVGRGLKLTPNPIKVLAQKHTIPVFTDIKEFLNTSPLGEVGLVAAYGRLIGPKTLAKFASHIYGIHPSLLPKYRGPSPLQQQILDGITATGVTLLQLDLGEDTGPIVAQATDVISPTDTTQSLGERLFLKGTDLFLDLLKTFPSLRLREGLGEGYRPQIEAEATDTPMITRQSGFLPWDEFIKFDCDRKFRAYFGWPGIWSKNPNGKRVKLVSLKPKIIILEEGKKPQYLSNAVSS